MDRITKICPHCKQEVELNEEFKVQQCPNCGKHIVPCNLCPLLAKYKCANNCPLETMADEMNKVQKEKKSFVTDLYALETNAIGEIIDIMLQNRIFEVKLDDLSEDNDGIVVYCFDDDANCANAVKIVKVVLHKSVSFILLIDDNGISHHTEDFHLGTMQFIYKAIYEKIYE